jgi:hypothetical protein
MLNLASVCSESIAGSLLGSLDRPPMALESFFALVRSTLYVLGQPEALRRALHTAPPALV